MTGRLGIDVGGTKVALRLEVAGQPPRETVLRWAAGATAEADLRALGEAVTGLCAGWGEPVGAVGAIGVAMPATVDHEGRVTAWPSRPSWTGLDLGPALRNLVPGAAVALADDGDLAALAEAEHAGAANLVYLGVGTGIGGGLVLDGRLCPGPARGSCEIGHLIIALDGPLCRCGRRGCLQAIASGPATLRRAGDLRAGNRRPTTSTSTSTATGTSTSTSTGTAASDAADAADAADADVDYPELREAWGAGSDWARTAVGMTAAALAAAVAGLTELVRPDLAVIGGGFADGLAGFVDEVAARTRALSRPGHPPVPVQAAQLGGLSSLAGALLLARTLDPTSG
ncbi:kanosamine 6-kinase [Parafrankia irregularis]|uniref:Kanosamine 6-kinase n=1 Tax=Parafrankia irregularis TaxID=795642 RepID=A0A0S4QPD1_9ACTN|nr:MULTISPECIES: ROK family protein [Parafrankia]MBE3206231.1 ROK family protein [Parafrankia sp. CH37]CUU57547.1 kanosamine 6-kinase [Parafrankia irregularis]